MDNQSEALVQQAIARIACDRTVILVAHRLSSIVQADKIIVLEHGTVVEEATHAALIAKQGLYRELYSRDGYPERANGQGDTRGEGEPPPRGPLAAERGEA